VRAVEWMLWRAGGGMSAKRACVRDDSVRGSARMYAFVPGRGVVDWMLSCRVLRGRCPVTASVDASARALSSGRDGKRMHALAGVMARGCKVGVVSGRMNGGLVALVSRLVSRLFWSGLSSGLSSGLVCRVRPLASFVLAGVRSPASSRIACPLSLMAETAPAHPTHERFPSQQACCHPFGCHPK
jgi:hypothetical protein